eukprot:1188718-Prorocentrum_minimum.AAC.8
MATMAGHVGPVWSLAYGAGGNMLASGAADSSVRLWNVNQLDAADKTAPAQAGSETRKGGEGGAPNPPFGSCLKTLHTKNTQVFAVKFTHRNLLLSAGPELPPKKVKKIAA